MDTYILTVRGNPALNDTELYCQYRAGEPLHNCNQETNAIIRIYDKTEGEVVTMIMNMEDNKGVARVYFLLRHWLNFSMSIA